jgi:hypothetical protein
LPRKLLSALWWLLPPCFALYVYWSGLFAWFQQDDFAWFNLANQIHGAKDLAAAVFVPTDHGTWRPLSERLYFIVLHALFGYRGLPFHIVTFLTQFANLALIASITTRLSGSRLAGLLAPIFWIASSQLIVMMTWSSEYILPMCIFFLLLAFHFLLRYAATAETRYWRYCWAAYLTGFLAMESNVVFPLLAASYAFLYSPKVFRKTLLLFIPAVIYTAVHMTFTGHDARVYTPHFDASMLRTFLIYCWKALQPVNLAAFSPFRLWIGPAAAALFGVALLGFVLWQSLKRNWLPLMLFGWFAFMLGPVLPLRDHITDYYLTIPMIALGMLGAVAVAAAWRSNVGAKAVAVLLAALFLAESVPVAKGGAEWWSANGRAVDKLARVVFRIHRERPDQTIVLHHVNSLLFWIGLAHQPFTDANGESYVRITPQSLPEIEARPETGLIPADYVYPADKLQDALTKGRAIIIDARQENYVDITLDYRPAGSIQPTRTLEVANPIYAPFLGPEWHKIDGNHRWMPRRATVSLAGPDNPREKLHLSGYCAAGLLANGPVTLTAVIAGRRSRPETLREPDRNFDLWFDLPPETFGKPSVEIALELSRGFRVPNDGRELGVAFGAIEIAEKPGQRR